MTSTNAYATQKCASSHYLPFLTIVEPNHHRATTLSHPADYHEQSIEIGLNQAIQSPITRTHNLLQHRCTRCIHSSDMQRNKEPAVLTGLSSFDASLPHLPEEFENHSTGSRNNSAILVPHARNKHLRSPPPLVGESLLASSPLTHHNGEKSGRDEQRSSRPARVSQALTRPTDQSHQ